MRITPAYQSLQAEFHRLKPSYGTGGRHYAEHTRELAAKLKAKTILDYGAGKRSLRAAAPDLPIAEYDPAVPGIDGAPSPADLVICVDVLEHIEPECLDEVLEHLHDLTLMACFVAVQCAPASKVLQDGRNAHLIVQPPSWWFERFAEARFASTEYFEAEDAKAFSALMVRA